MIRLLPTLFLLTLSMPALADIQVRFVEGAPKDRFTITNLGNCELATAQMTIDLSGSPYGLVFDVTARGAGVQVFQPFEVTRGQQFLGAQPLVRDGDNQVTLDLVGLAAGGVVSFTIDVDDTAQSREITVSGDEIIGSQVVLHRAGVTLAAPFEANGVALAEYSACLS